MLVNQEQHSLGQSSIPRWNPTTAPIPPGPSGIAPLTVPLSDYEWLQKDVEELKHQNNELKTSNEENVRRLQGITALLQELMPDMGRSGAAEEHGRSRDNLPRAPQPGVRRGTPELNDQVREAANPWGGYDRRSGKAPMYEETAESTHSRALCVPSPRKNELDKEMLKASDVKRLIEEVLEQRQVTMIPREAPTRGFPLSEELQR